MSKKANPTAIGVFVVVAAALAVVGILILGSGKLFEKSITYILYFEGDLNGLDVGAPVTTRGVQIGTVEKISIVYDHKTQTFTTPVIIKILQSSFVEVNRTEELMDGRNINLHVERGLRARLETLSFVTGQLRVNLDFHPQTEAVYRAKDSELPEIPTIPTTLQSLAKRLSELPVEEIVTDLRTSMAAVAAFFESGKLESTFDELNKTITEISDVVKSSDMKSVIRSLDETLKKSQVLMGELSRSARPLQRDMAIAIEEFSDAARAAQYLLEYLERHPEALIHGKGSEK